MLGRKTNALITEEGKENSYIGRNESYKQVVVKNDDFLIGRDVKVEIIDCSQFDLKGKIVED